MQTDTEVHDTNQKQDIIMNHNPTHERTWLP